MENERELPMLAGISSIMRFFEELLNILNGPILMFGAGIALVDLLTDGALSADVPILLFAWAISQALGIDTQLLGCFARARNALRAARGWAVFGWIALGLILGYAAWQAGYVFAVQQSQHITEAQALAQLNMSPALWLGWRAFLAVGLVALSGWTRYHAPAPNVAATAEEEKAKLEAELQLEPLRDALRVQKARGARGVVAALRGKEPAALPAPATAPTARAPKTTPLAPTHSRPPTGPGTPVTAHASQSAPAQADSLPPGVIDETEQAEDERENSRVVHIGRSRSARAANKRLRQQQRNARDDVIAEAVYDVLNTARAADESIEAISMRDLERRVNEHKQLVTLGITTSARTIKRHLANWHRDQMKHAAK